MVFRRSIALAAWVAFAGQALAAPDSLLNRSGRTPAPVVSAKAGQPSDDTRSSATAAIEGYRYEQAAKVWASADKRTIYLVGEIVPGTFAKFAAVAAAAPLAKTLFLASSGGAVHDGYMIGAAVRELALDTWVEHECSSACTQIFAGGKQRLLGPNATLGFHQTYSEARNGDARGTDYSSDEDLARLLDQKVKFGGPGTSDRLMVTSLRWAKAPDSFIGKVMRTSPDTMWNPDKAELLSVGFATRLVGKEPALQAPETAVALQTVTKQLLSERFWQVLKRREPALFDKALLTIWREANSGTQLDDSVENTRTALYVELRPKIATASDALIERLFTALAVDGERQRFNAYPACTGLPPQRGAMNAVGVRASLLRLGDVYADLLESPGSAARLSSDDAIKFLTEQTKLLDVSTLDFSAAGNDGKRYCRLIYLTDEAVQALQGKQRLRAARAWLAVELL